jgi:hypothetical protein
MLFASRAFFLSIITAVVACLVFFLQRVRDHHHRPGTLRTRDAIA